MSFGYTTTRKPYTGSQVTSTKQSDNKRAQNKQTKLGLITSQLMVEQYLNKPSGSNGAKHQSGAPEGRGP